MENFEPFPVPTEIDCNDIAKENPSYKLDFQIPPYKYIVSIPTEIDQRFLNKITTPLTLDELNGSEDGVYTWILFDYGIGTEKEIIVKKNINITEISTKHLDILKGVCVNEHKTTNDLSHPSMLRVYVGGELSKTTNFENRSIYNINLLSGTYSVDKIDAEHFSSDFELRLKDIFIKGLHNKDNTDVNIERTTNTMIKIKDMESFEQQMLDTYGVAGVKIYKFGREHNALFIRSLPYASSTYKTQLAILDRVYPVPAKRTEKDDEQYKEAKEKLFQKYGPLTKTELSQFELKKETSGHSRGGGKHRKSKIRKSKAKKHKTRKR